MNHAHSYLEDLPTEVLQTVANYLPDHSLCAFLATSRSIRLKLHSNKYFWRTRFLLQFDPPVFFDNDRLVTDADNLRIHEVAYDYSSQYRQRAKALVHRKFTADDMAKLLDMIADHSEKNYRLLAQSEVVSEFLKANPSPALGELTKHQLDVFYAIKSVLIPALGFLDIPPRPLDPVYRIVYDSPRNPLFDPVSGLPQLHVISALVTFWQMMNKPRALRVFPKGMDKIEVLTQVFNNHDRRRHADRILHDFQKDSEKEEPDDSHSLASSADNDVQQIQLTEFSDDAGDDESAWETDSEHNSSPKQNIYLGIFAFFNYWDFELFRSAPLSSETRRSIIGDVVDWYLDIPDNICGPISFRSTGTSHQISGVRQPRRCIVEISPIEEPLMGVRGWAKFCMRQLEFEVDGVYEEQRWVHNAVMLPGSKAVVGRWHDGFDDDIERAVEGPILWVRQ